MSHKTHTQIGSFILYLLYPSWETTFQLRSFWEVDVLERFQCISPHLAHCFGHSQMVSRSEISLEEHRRTHAQYFSLQDTWRLLLHSDHKNVKVSYSSKIFTYSFQGNLYVVLWIKAEKELFSNLTSFKTYDFVFAFCSMIPGGAYMRQWYESSLIGLMAWRLLTQIHYLNPCWLIINYIFGKKRSRIWIKIHSLSFRKTHLKVVSATQQPFFFIPTLWMTRIRSPMISASSRWWVLSRIVRPSNNTY